MAFKDYLQYMQGLRFGDRLDQFDYERLGVEEKWGPRITMLLLTSFEMETKGYYDREDAAKAYNTIYSKYKSVVCKPLRDKAFPFFPGPDVPEEHAFDMDKARFKQEDFLVYLEANNRARVDIPRLQRFLHGEELPGVGTVEAVDQVEFKLDNVAPHTNEKINGLPANIEGYAAPKTVNEYRFERMDNGWIIQYEDVTLRGVRDSVGLHYIRELLKNRGQKISVLRLQQLIGSNDFDGSTDYEISCHGNNDGRLANTDLEEATDGYDYLECDSGSLVGGGSNLWEVLDPTAVASYKKRIAEIEEQLANARAGKAFNRTKIDRLEEEKAAIEAQLSEASYKPKDPELEINRQRVWKNIRDAIAKIRKLESSKGYNDQLISRHLHRHIKTGANCSYADNEETLLPWKL